jgi:DnaK suppressor protein
MTKLKTTTHERYTDLKRILEDHRQHLQRSLAARLSDVREHIDRDRQVIQASDAADASASDLEQHCGVALAELAAQSLRQVDQALRRLESGEYGLCMECDEPIAGKRLKALPFAVRCRDCEELRELGERGGRTSARSHESSLAFDGFPRRLMAHERE